MTSFVGFTTYPAELPVHGGQRRVRALVDFYRSIGIQYETVCIYEKANYGPATVGVHDLPLEGFDPDFDGIPLIGDLLSGVIGAAQSHVKAHFLKLLLERKPQAIILEHPFMWPLIKILREHPEIGEIPLIYSSHNWEAPLKYDMLTKSGVEQRTALKVSRKIEEIERELADASRMVLAVSEADAAVYRNIAPQAHIVVVKNGVDRPNPQAVVDPGMFRDLKEGRYFFFVGSAYPPNVGGICDLLLDGGLFFVPPEATFAICGGVAGGAFQHPHYQKFLAANSDRVRFFEKISDHELELIKANALAILLPIDFGGGSNLKTAEALASGKWVVATSTSLRGFEEFMGEPGVVIADDRVGFRKAVMDVYRKPALELSNEAKILRESVYWERRFSHLRSEFLKINIV